MRPARANGNDLCPDHERHEAVSVPEVSLERLRTSAARAVHQASPLRRGVHIERVPARRQGASGVGGIEMRVNGFELLVVVLIRVLVRRRIARVIHAGPERGIVEVLVLVIEPERVTHLLAHYQLSPRRRVVRCGIEIGVVHLDGTLRDVAAADPDLRDAQPAVIAVRAVADLNTSRGRLAVARSRLTGDDERVEHARRAPVTGRNQEMTIPCRGDVVAQADCKRVRRARPMVSIP